MKTAAYAPALLLALALLGPLHAAAESREGSVELPLSRYAELAKAAEHAPPKDAPPVDYVLGEGTASLTLNMQDGRPFAEIDAVLALEVLKDRWQLVPLLPAKTAVVSAYAADQPIRLAEDGRGLGWAVAKTGVYALRLKYRAPAEQSEEGGSVSLPLPGGAGVTLTASLPAGLGAVAVSPSAGHTLSRTTEGVELQAAILPAPQMQLSWQAAPPAAELSRAEYRGRLAGDAALWNARYLIEASQDRGAEFELFPEETALGSVKLDGQEAAVRLRNGKSAVRLSGKGNHTLEVEWEVPIQPLEGAPGLVLPVPLSPINQIEFLLPGQKEVRLTPCARVRHQREQDHTRAAGLAPAAREIRISWSEALPQEPEAQLSANAVIYHFVHAADGLLTARARAQHRISRGKISRLMYELPAGVQINQVAGAAGAILDWQQAPLDHERAGLTVFLNREMDQDLELEIAYDLSLPKDRGTAFEVPLLTALQVQRQRGMIALLADKDLTLEPVEEVQLTAVGDNQIPAPLKQDGAMAIVHTFKYVESRPRLKVKAAALDKKQGRFHAMVHTLVSLGDVTLKGASTVEINLKSGRLSDLSLALPSSVSVLGLAAPALRTYHVVPGDGRQTVAVEFTQEMEGEFELDLQYELIMDDPRRVAVPALHIDSAEVEQGRIAIEALSPVEVQPAAAQRLSKVDPAELPQSLVLKTTNPILQAYKYVHADPPYELGLSLTRHRELELQESSIESAQYNTLFTQDGTAVTAARFMVRNTRQQFFKIQLPAGSKIWSAAVDGRREQPALDERAGTAEDAKGASVLIKIINSAEGFPVTLTYQSPSDGLGPIGALRAVLPRPEMIVSQSRWNLYLPDDHHYGRPHTNMRFIGKGSYAEQDSIKQNIMQTLDNSTAQFAGPVEITVPAAGIYYAFEKLYANQGAEDAFLTIPYVGEEGGLLCYLLAVAGALLLFGSLGFRRGWLKPAGFAVGLALTLLPPIYLGTSAEYTALIAGLSIAAAALSRWGLPLGRLGRLRSRRSAEEV